MIFLGGIPNVEPDIFCVIENCGFTEPVSTGLHRHTDEVDSRTGDVRGHFGCRGEDSLIHTPAWPDKFLFKAQRNEFGALERKPLNVVQLISQDNSRHCHVCLVLNTQNHKTCFYFYFFLEKKMVK